MSQFETSNIYAVDENGLKSYVMSVYTRMSMAMILTAAVAYAGYHSLETGGIFAKLYYHQPWLVMVVLVLQLVMCMALSLGIRKFSTFTVTGLFYGYAAFTGITFSTLPYAYGLGSIFTAFAFTAVMFISCVVIGRTTKTDMTKFSGILMAGLITLLITTVVSMFVPALRNNLIISYLGVALFLGLTVYDMQKIKRFYYMDANRENLGVYGAFQLYLDFINLFLQILRIVARNNSRKK